METREEPAMEALHVRDGVVLMRGVIPPQRQPEVCAQLLNAHPTRQGLDFLGPAYRTNPFLAFAHLFTVRLPRRPAQEVVPGSVPALLSELSDSLHRTLYGPGGLWADKAENGCSEDHEGRPCSCPDRTPFLPRSTRLNCIEGLVYRAGAQRGYHRDAHWMLALTFGCDVKMGFHRHDEEQPFSLTVPSGDAVLFNGALHSHAVLGIGEASSAPAWWDYPFARAVFLMRDARQTIGARRRQQARRAAAGEAAKEAAAMAAARLEPEVLEEESEGEGTDEDVEDEEKTEV